jgi:hypothetical protein
MAEDDEKQERTKPFDRYGAEAAKQISEPTAEDFAAKAAQARSEGRG